MGISCQISSGTHTQEPQNLSKILIMNGIFISCLAVLALSNVSEAFFLFGTGAATAGTALTLGTGGSAAALGLLGGAFILKGLVLGAALLASRSRGGRRHGRSAEAVEDNEIESAFAILASAEPAQCYRRLICDLAAGAIPDNEKILTLFTEDVSPVSPKFEYATAAKVGKLVKNANICELRYSCPFNTADIQKIFA